MTRSFETLLTESGWPAPATLPSWVDEYDVEGYRGKSACRAPLARRGWLVHFDIEDETLSSPVALTRKLLQAGSVHQRLECEFIGEGYLMHLAQEDAAAAFISTPNDTYAPDHVAIAVSAAQYFLSGHDVEIVELRTGDQTMILAVLPVSVVELMREHGVGKLYDPTRVVVTAPPAELKDELLRKEAEIERLVAELDKDDVVLRRQVCENAGAGLRADEGGRRFLLRALQDSDDEVVRWAHEKVVHLFGESFQTPRLAVSFLQKRAKRLIRERAERSPHARAF